MSAVLNFKSHLADLFAQALRSVAPDHDGATILIERPKQASHGDYACNLAMQLAKPLRKSPRDIANALIAALPKSEVIGKVEIAGAGFINVFVTAAAKQEVVRGAVVMTRTRCARLARRGERWAATLERADGGTIEVEARAVVNATGPWVDRFLDEATPVPARRHPRQVKGSHIVVPRLFTHEFAYIFQSPDGRIVFAIPFERDYTLIGTTEMDYGGDLATPQIAEAEILYLLDMANRCFAGNLGRHDPVWTFAGLRPLLADPKDRATSVTRDYVLDVDTEGAPLLSIYGGKLTTCRKLAEDVVDALASRLDCRSPPWTAGQPRPGGYLPDADFDGFLAALGRRHPWVPAALLHRYARAYGTRTARILQDAASLDDLDEEVLPGLYAREIEYLRREEWAVTAEDILYRRSKLALHVPAGSEARLVDWLRRHAPRGRAGSL